jgi:hypothetical protein
VKKNIILLTLAACISGCSTGNEALTIEKEMKTQCIAGIVYYIFRETAGNLGFGYMSPKFNKDGTIATCDY